MDTTVLVALVLTLTQVAKSWLKEKLGGKWMPWMGIGVSLLVTVGVVIYKSQQVGIPLNLDLLWTVVVVFALANGAKKLIPKPK